jgi:hypothetical protein
MKYNKAESTISDELFITVLVLIVLLVPLSKNISSFNKELKDIFNKIIRIITSHFLLMCLGILVGCFIVYLIYGKISQKIEEKEIQKTEKSSIWRFLNLDLRSMEPEEIKAEISKIKSKNFESKAIDLYDKEIKDKIKEANKILFEEKHRKILLDLENEKLAVKIEIERLKEKERSLGLTREQKIELIKEKLRIDDNTVYLKDSLSRLQIKVLVENGFRHINEYCVKEKKVIPVLVRPFTNHSNTHAFLVWSIKRLLESYDKIKDIDEHLTKDADITFVIHNQWYAIEVETGNLLGKKKQLDEKITYLNRAYSDRWFIVVSHRNLISKYKEYGACTQRSGVQKMVEKLLKF